MNDLEVGLGNGSEIALSPVQTAMETIEFPNEPVLPENDRNTARKLLDKLPSQHEVLVKYTHDRMLEMAVLAEQGHDFRVFQDLQALRMGDLAIDAVPGEPFLDLGETLMKNANRSFPLAVSVANGDAGYLPTPELFRQDPDPFCCDDYGAFGFYEVWFGPGLLRAKFKPDIVSFVAEKLLALELH